MHVLGFVYILSHIVIQAYVNIGLDGIPHYPMGFIAIFCDVCDTVCSLLFALSDSCYN